MTDTEIAWVVVLAVALFWSVGAYNRLMRLRALALAAFSALDRHLGHYVVLVDEHLKAASGLALAQAVAAPRSAGPATAWAGLQGASTQFEASLRVARKQVLDAGAMAALQTAHATLQMSWARVQEEGRDYQDLLSPKGRQQWTENARLATHAVAGFNHAVLAYNAAVTQFPALVLAYLFSFRPAGCL